MPGFDDQRAAQGSTIPPEILAQMPERRGGLIHEGPLLDVLLDYRVLADRIIYGTLGEVLARAGHPPPAGDAFTPPEDAAEDD